MWPFFHFSLSPLFFFLKILMKLHERFSCRGYVTRCWFVRAAVHAVAIILSLAGYEPRDLIPCRVSHCDSRPSCQEKAIGQDVLVSRSGWKRTFASFSVVVILRHDHFFCLSISARRVLLSSCLSPRWTQEELSQQHLNGHLLAGRVAGTS